MTPKNPNTETKILKRLSALADNLCRAHCTKVNKKKWGSKITIHSDGCITLHDDLHILWKNKLNREEKSNEQP